MTDQGDTDRAEELRGLSFEALIERTVAHRTWMKAVQNEPRLGAPSDFEKGAEIQAEWDRRCAEREAQEAEVERLRDTLWKVVTITEHSANRRRGETVEQSMARAILEIQNTAKEARSDD